MKKALLCDTLRTYLLPTSEKQEYTDAEISVR